MMNDAGRGRIAAARQTLTGVRHRRQRNALDRCDLHDVGFAEFSVAEQASIRSACYRASCGFHRLRWTRHLNEPGTRLPPHAAPRCQSPVWRVHHHRRNPAQWVLAHCLLVALVPWPPVGLRKTRLARPMVCLVIQVAAKREDFLDETGARRHPAENRIDVSVCVQLRIPAQPVPPSPLHQEEVASRIAVENVGGKNQPPVQPVDLALSTDRAAVVFISEASAAIGIPESVRAKERVHMRHVLRAKPEPAGETQIRGDFLRQVPPVDSIEPLAGERRASKPPYESGAVKQVGVCRQQESPTSPAEARALRDGTRKSGIDRRWATCDRFPQAPRRT